MARPAPVPLSKLHPVRFPDRCPVCGKVSPGHTLALDQLFGIYRPVSDDVFGRWQSQLPVCKEHERRLRLARRSDLLSVVGFALAGFAGLLYLVRFEMFAAGWWSWAAVLATGLLPIGLIRLALRPIFDIAPDDDLVEFELRNTAYAKDFIALNR
ncbi:hypothetical protein DB30_06089 [Enhygromyxa salina]|uniref:Transmembrane protein n=1 Tax=Enhygromyxa salina TaxID=215803 RepID=A0A0C2D4P9_9BACT|nr:hypothetical protein [Enhygromyxa salina]KIG15057.1 hypothetical protein DB30_06089 [Enhygromyxa salina]